MRLGQSISLCATVFAKSLSQRRYQVSLRGFMASKQLRSFAIEYEVNYELELLDDLSPRPAGLLDFPPSDVGES